MLSLIKRTKIFDRIIHPRIFYFDCHPNFLHLNFPTIIPTILRSPPSEITPGDRWPQSLINNFLRCNPPKYKSNQHKQLLLITTRFLIACSKFNIKRRKKNFHPRSACDHEFKTGATSKENYFLKLAEDLRRTFPSRGNTSWTHLLTPKIFIPLIHIRNKKNDILDSPCIPILELNQEHKRWDFSRP